MPRDLHLHPDRLGAHAVTAAALSEELRAALHAAPDVRTPDEERVLAAARRAARELAALGAALAEAAAGYEAADRVVAQSFDHVRDEER